MSLANVRRRAATGRGCAPSRRHLARTRGCARRRFRRCSPMRRRAGRSVSAGPSISTRLPPIRRRRASPPSIGERERIAALHDSLEGFRARHGGAAVEAEARANGAYLLGVEYAADERDPIVRSKPAKLHVLGGQAVPDGQQQAGGEPETRLPVARKFADLMFPEHAPMVLVSLAPIGGIELGPGHAVAGCRADQLHALLHAAIVEHARRGRQDDGGTLRTGVEDQSGLAIRTGIARAHGKRGLGGGRFQPVATDDLDQLGNGAGAGMFVQGRAWPHRLRASRRHRIAVWPRPGWNIPARGGRATCSSRIDCPAPSGNVKLGTVPVPVLKRLHSKRAFGPAPMAESAAQ